MPCVECGRWSFRYRWFSTYKPEGECPDHRWLGGNHIRDGDDPNLFWVIKCVPFCEANRLLVELEAIEAALAAQLAALRVAIEAAHTELDEAWC